MAKFKKGDRVRIIKAGYNNYDIGDVGFVCENHTTIPWVVKYEEDIEEPMRADFKEVICDDALELYDEVEQAVEEGKVEELREAEEALIVPDSPIPAKQFISEVNFDSFAEEVEAMGEIVGILKDLSPASRESVISQIQRSIQ